MHRYTLLLPVSTHRKFNNSSTNAMGKIILFIATENFEEPCTFCS